MTSRRGVSRNPRPRKDETSAERVVVRPPGAPLAPPLPPLSAPVEGDSPEAPMADGAPSWGGPEPDEASQEIGVPAPLSALEALEARWQDMRESEPAAPDDISSDLRGIVAGTSLMVTEFSDEHGPTAEVVVAVAPPCRGVPGVIFVWACTPEHWTIHLERKDPVFIRTIDLERVTRLPVPGA